MMALAKSVLIAVVVAAFSSVASYGQCAGDLNGDMVVGIDELIKAVDNAVGGCPLIDDRFVDNGDGTVTDNSTGLMWEVKTAGENCLHCVSQQDRRTWLAAMGPWISEVNGFAGDVPDVSQSGFAGHEDWRVPTIAELQSLVDCSEGFPCIDPLFGEADECFFWSSSKLASSPSLVYTIYFVYGTIIASSTEQTANCSIAVRRP